jgi:hypothetical protein
LRERFQSASAKALSLSALIPAFCTDAPFENLRETINMYAHFLPGNVDSIETEYLRWQSHWRRHAVHQRPTVVLEALKSAVSLSTYPCIDILLRIFATLPVTTASSERSFSALKYLKNYLRSTMGENRLNGLALVYIHRDMPLNYNDVIDEFSKNSRRIDL